MRDRRDGDGRVVAGNLFIGKVDNEGLIEFREGFDNLRKFGRRRDRRRRELEPRERDEGGRPAREDRRGFRFRRGRRAGEGSRSEGGGAAISFTAETREKRFELTAKGNERTKASKRRRANEGDDGRRTDAREPREQRPGVRCDAKAVRLRTFSRGTVGGHALSSTSTREGGEQNSDRNSEGPHARQSSEGREHF